MLHSHVRYMIVERRTTFAKIESGTWLEMVIISSEGGTWIEMVHRVILSVARVELGQSWN